LEAYNIVASLLLLHPLIGFAETGYQSWPTRYTYSNTRDPAILTQFHIFFGKSPQSEDGQQLFTAASRHPRQECLQKGFFLKMDIISWKQIGHWSHHQLSGKELWIL